MNNISKNALQFINRKSGKKISEQAIKKIASSVKPSTFKSDSELRSLIMQVSKMANIPVSDATVNEIIRTVKGAGGTGLAQLIKSMLSK
ncbi:hypothetical protein SD70_19560 [Gordoniibacillus kamchatkensis]|uniref:Stage VI sporulation protein F n=1 Tax=Gordoniibacillus kamchatkensis TaxID=1590651 RepID=A0ABR5AES7_9BACL|nr:stage VI sporulation protein F [Paenibacillus sp. VKM B-2647]KIL39486.1 hypothetical protein SD70_19560 [Paenibacillus sp. VKM B-2647]